MDVRDDSQCPETPNLLTDEDGVSPDHLVLGHKKPSIWRLTNHRPIDIA
jgi:hypothetical protein